MLPQGSFTSTETSQRYTPFYLEKYLLKLTLPNPSSTTNWKKALIHSQPPSSHIHLFCPDSKISIRWWVFLKLHLKRFAYFHQCIFCSAWITDFYPENAPDLLQFSALISVTYIKKVLCANSCVKTNQAEANLAKMESVEEKLFRSDRESIVIFYPLMLYAFLKLWGEEKQCKQTKKAKNSPNKLKHTKKEGS